MPPITRYRRRDENDEQYATRLLTQSGGYVPRDVATVFSQPVYQQPKDDRSLVSKVGGFLLGNTAKLANTTRALGEGVYGLADISRESIFGSDEGYQKKVNQVANRLDELTYGSNKGLFGKGTFFKDKEDYEKVFGKDGEGTNYGEFTKRVAGGGLGTASEILPFTRGGQAVSKAAAAGQGFRQAAPKVFAEGVAYGTTGNVGQQLVETGKVDPVEAVKGGAAGGVISTATFGLGRGYKGGKQAVNQKMNQATQQRLTQQIVKNPQLLDDFVVRAERNIAANQARKVANASDEIAGGAAGRNTAPDGDDIARAIDDAAEETMGANVLDEAESRGLTPEAVTQLQRTRSPSVVNRILSDAGESVDEATASRLASTKSANRVAGILDEQGIVRTASRQIDEAGTPPAVDTTTPARPDTTQPTGILGGLVRTADESQRIVDDLAPGETQLSGTAKKQANRELSRENNVLRDERKANTQEIKTLQKNIEGTNPRSAAYQRAQARIQELQARNGEINDLFKTNKQRRVAFNEEQQGTGLPLNPRAVEAAEQIGRNIESFGFGDVVERSFTDKNTLYRRLVQGVSDRFQNRAAALLNRGGAMGRIGSLVQDFFGTFGKTREIAELSRNLGGAKNVNDRIARQFYSQANAAAEEVAEITGKSSLEVKRAVVAAIDPDAVGKKEARRITKNMTPEEQVLANAVRTMSDAISEIAYRTGTITKQQYEGLKGKYLTRVIDDVDKTYNQWFDEMGSPLREMNVYSQSRKQITAELRNDLMNDPFLSLAVQFKYVDNNIHIRQVVDSIAQMPNVVSDTARYGFVQIPSSDRWGALAGKYVSRNIMESFGAHVYLSNIARTADAFLSSYARSAPVRYAKGAKTSLSVAGRFGNQAGNALMGFFANNANPRQFTKFLAYQRKYNFLLNQEARTGQLSKDTWVRRAAASGIDMGNAANEELAVIARGMTGEGRGTRSLKLAARSYGNADTAAKTAQFRTFIEQGFSDRQAAELTNKFFQDYNSVGRFFQFVARTPVVGRTFVRFAVDFQRILKNAAVYSPLSVATLYFGVDTLQKYASAASGETPEEKEFRENQAFAGGRFQILPGIYLPTTVRVGDNQIDFRRFMGNSVINQPEGRGGAMLDFYNRVSPLQVRTNEDTGAMEVDLEQSVQGDITTAPVMALLTDEDFRGKSISDPLADEKYTTLSASGERIPDYVPSESDRNRNRLEFLLRGYSPSVALDTYDVKQAAQGRPDYFTGNTKFQDEQKPADLGDKIFRAIAGVRVTDVSDTRDKMRTSQNIERSKQVNAALDETIRSLGLTQEEIQLFNGLFPDHKQYERTGNNTREKIPYPEFNDPYYRQRKASTLLNPKIFQAARAKAFADYEKNGKPIDPIFLIRDGRIIQNILNTQTLFPGESGTLKKQLLYNQAWYPDYQKALDAYYDAKDAYTAKLVEAGVIPADSQNFDRDQDDIPPTQRPENKKLVDAYNALGDDKAAKRAFMASNPRLAEIFDEQDFYTNRKRMLYGLPPIFDTGFGGYGGGGGSGGGSRSTDQYILQATKKVDTTIPEITGRDLNDVTYSAKRISSKKKKNKLAQVKVKGLKSPKRIG